MRIVEWSLLAGTVLATLALALLAIGWLAPGLLGMPGDLRVVQTAERVAPFYDGVLREEDRARRDYLLEDPLTLKRARPFFPAEAGFGPTDLLGFRNRSVPVRADVVTVGDSQTYGTGVPMDSAWPHRLRRQMRDGVVVYDMSAGGWGAVQYLYMCSKAIFFQPKVAIVAFYPGNDPRESFRMAYAVEHWSFLRPDAALDVEDLPRVAWPPPDEDRWPVALGGVPLTVFTPRLRLASNVDHPGIDAGWEIMARVAEQIVDQAPRFGFTPVFTILPTKERVFAERLRREGIDLDPDYAILVAAEERRSESLKRRILDGGATYVDVLAPLERAASTGVRIYPTDQDGHPTEVGHAVISNALLPTVRRLLD
jgi:hypothetical protein